jgi:para-nitrobenzyl esterase
MNLRLKIAIGTLVAMVFSASTISLSAADDSVISTQSGPLRRITSGPVNQYLGIPYAAPPLGARRWLPPKPFGQWQGVFPATRFGSECPQVDPFSNNEFGSENCLFLNVYTPRPKDDSQALPVMVWIHGGALITGGGDLYDPAPLVERGVIVVTINYRLGLLGFFAHPALDAEGHLNANYGLMDQQLALKWVRRNIAAFGGDPARVTIFGESAGGQSVHMQLASPGAAGLFQRAIAESGSFDDFQDYLPFIVPLAQGETTGTGLVPSGVAFAAAAGCGSQTAACLRGLTAAAVVGVQPTLPSALFPFIDGTLVPQKLPSAFASGQFNHVPVIDGATHDEGRLFVNEAYDFRGTPLTDAGYQAAVAALELLPVTDPFVQFLVNVAYPLTNYPPPPPFLVSAPLALGALFTDEIFDCPERNADQLLSKYVTIYTYEFNDENAPLSFGVPQGSFPLGAYHAAEIQYLMNIFGIPAPFTSDQQLLSNTMISYWTHFAKTGNPNSANTPHWSPYNSLTDRFQSLAPPTPTVESTFDSEHGCSALWNTF